MIRPKTESLSREHIAVKIIFWREDDGFWLGCLRGHPDYWTQGEDLDDLRDHLEDIYSDLTRGLIT